ncbi:hypothetical protein [uncultured Arcticibacterium sp.]|uniref:hypothetical protein n=1 Tax=uncultured Arcticibacterium sp. TaxID=2173042 RepID=UPI0030FC2D1F
MKFNPLHIPLSRWAAQNIAASRILFAFTEILRISIAFYLGKAFLAPLAIQEYLIICIALLCLSYVLIKRKTKRSLFKRYFQKGFVLMTCSWLLYFCTGSFFSNVESDTSKISVLANDVQTTKKSGLLKETIQKNKVQIKGKEKSKMPFSTKRKILYALLFLLSLPLTVYGLGFACSLGCSGYVFLPWVFYILSFGVLAAGIFFLLKLISKKKPRKYRKLNKREKWKEWKSFLFTWLLTLGVIALLLFIISIIN